MSKIDMLEKICDDFRNRQEEQWYRRDDFVASTIDEMDEILATGVEDDGSTKYVEVISIYEALKDEQKGDCYAHIW